MRFSTSFSVLCAALSLAPLALAMPFDYDSVDGLEVRAFDGDVEAALFARGRDPPRYRTHNIIEKKPKYYNEGLDPKYRDHLERNGGLSRDQGHGRRELSFWY